MAIKRRIYPTRYGQMHVRSVDGTGLTLVLLHQSPRSGEMWEERQTRTTRPTYAPDRLGYGFSEAPPWALSLEQYAACTVDALRSAGITAPLDVLGIHAGSMEAAEGGHILAAWRGAFAFRQPPYDLADVHRRVVEHLLAANPGAAFRAASGYAIDKKLKGLKAPLTVFAVHDELLEQTERIKALLKPEDVYVDLPGVTQDPFHAAVGRMAELVGRHLAE